MAGWKILFADKAERQFAKLDAQTKQRILHYLETRVASATDPHRLGKSLRGTLSGYWRYRVGDYRVICKIENGTLTVIVVEVGHRRDIYD